IPNAHPSLGEVWITPGARAALAIAEGDDPEAWRIETPCAALDGVLARLASGDDGDQICAEDRSSNRQAYAERAGRVLSVYRLRPATLRALPDPGAPAPRPPLLDVPLRPRPTETTVLTPDEY